MNKYYGLEKHHETNINRIGRNKESGGGNRKEEKKSVTKILPQLSGDSDRMTLRRPLCFPTL